VGAHTVEFKPVSGWTAPGESGGDDHQGSVDECQTGSYTPPSCSLQVTIQPPEAVAAGAQWRWTEGPGRTAGLTGRTSGGRPYGFVQHGNGLDKAGESNDHDQ